MTMTRTAMALLLAGALSTGALACLPPGAPGADVPHKHASPSGKARKAGAKRTQAAPAAVKAAPTARTPGAPPAQ